MNNHRTAIGPLEIPSVTGAKLERVVEFKGDPKHEVEREILTIYRCGCTGENLDRIPSGRQHIVVRGVDFGERQICCYNGGLAADGHVTVKWNANPPPRPGA